MANLEDRLTDEEQGALQEFDLAVKTVVLPVRVAPPTARRFRDLCCRFGVPQGAMLGTLLDVFEEELRSERLKLNIYAVPRGVSYRADLVWLEDSDNGSRSD